MYIIYMIRSILLIALMASLSFATPFSEHGKLSVNDGKLVDKNGNPYVLRGMSMFWNRSDWPGGKFYKQSTITTLAGSSWNANVVRAAIGDGSTQDAKNFIDWTSQAGIYVIIDWHKHDTDENGAKNFFRTVSEYAKGKGHVLYEIFNEPTTQSWASLKSYAENVIDVIKANDPDGIIIVGNPSYSSDLGSPMGNPITGTRAKNVMYTLHFYTSDPSHNTFQIPLKNAYCKKFPVFATEWGTSMADGGDKNKQMDWTRTNNWMSLVESIGLSWANWSIVDKDETAAALTLNCCGSGTFGDNNLSASGKYVQRIMKNRNSGGAINSANGGDPAVNLTQVNVDSECSSGAGTEAGKKTGIVKVGGSATDAVDFVPGSLSGAKDSTMINQAPALQNTANTFSVSYKLTDISGSGKYKMRVRYGAGSAVTVSWQGDGIESGSFELPSTSKSSTWKNSDYFPITITSNSSETPIKLTFNAGAASNFVLVNIQVGTDGPVNPTPSSANIPNSSSSAEEPNPIVLPQVVFSNSLNAMQNSVNLQVAREASFKVFDLKGNMVRSLKFTQGNHTVSLADLPKGLYVVKAQFGSQKEILRMPVK